MLSLDAAAGRVVADPGHLGQVLMNLVVNARDAIAGCGRVEIATRNAELDEAYAVHHPEARAGRYVCLSVSDTGCGMDAATMAKCFEPFFTTKPPGQGTGLGLSVVHGIVSQCGGHVAAESEPGHGTRFLVYLPRIDAPPSTGSFRVTGEHAWLHGTETVLIVEDMDAIRELASDVLTEAGYSVIQAPDGAAALRHCDREPQMIHLVLTDVVMPAVGGFDLALRLASRRPGTRFLFMSGYAHDSLADRAREFPSSRFLTKPFTPDVLLRAVRETLDAR